MINRLIWEILSKDDTDDNQASQEALLQSKYSEITDTVNYDYFWTSLKTYLGDNSLEWAQNKIHDRQEKDQFLQEDYKNDELPTIGISQTTPFQPLTRDYSRFSGEICLQIQAPKESNNLLVFKIYKRIKYLLFPSLGQYTQNVYCKNFSNYGLQNLEIKLDRVGEFYSRSLKIYLQVTFQEI